MEHLCIYFYFCGFMKMKFEDKRGFQEKCQARVRPQWYNGVYLVVGFLLSTQRGKKLGIFSTKQSMGAPEFAVTTFNTPVRFWSPSGFSANW